MFTAVVSSVKILTTPQSGSWVNRILEVGCKVLLLLRVVFYSGSCFIFRYPPGQMKSVSKASKIFNGVFIPATLAPKTSVVVEECTRKRNHQSPPTYRTEIPNSTEQSVKVEAVCHAHISAPKLVLRIVVYDGSEHVGPRFVGAAFCATTSCMHARLHARSTLRTKQKTPEVQDERGRGRLGVVWGAWPKYFSIPTDG